MVLESNNKQTRVRVHYSLPVKIIKQEGLNNPSCLIISNP